MVVGNVKKRRTPQKIKTMGRGGVLVKLGIVNEKKRSTVEGGPTISAIVKVSAWNAAA
jgi:hypothetical protein